MTGNDTQGETLSHKFDVRHCASTDGARRAQNCALYTSVCFAVSVPLFAMWFRLFMSVCRSQMFVNMGCRITFLYTFRLLGWMVSPLPSWLGGLSSLVGWVDPLSLVFWGPLLPLSLVVWGFLPRCLGRLSSLLGWHPFWVGRSSLLLICWKARKKEKKKWKEKNS